MRSIWRHSAQDNPAALQPNRRFTSWLWKPIIRKAVDRHPPQSIRVCLLGSSSPPGPSSGLSSLRYSRVHLAQCPSSFIHSVESTGEQRVGIAAVADGQHVRFHLQSSGLRWWRWHRRCRNRLASQGGCCLPPILGRFPPAVADDRPPTAAPPDGADQRRSGRSGGSRRERRRHAVRPVTTSSAHEPRRSVASKSSQGIT